MDCSTCTTCCMIHIRSLHSTLTLVQITVYLCRHINSLIYLHRNSGVFKIINKLLEFIGCQVSSLSLKPKQEHVWWPTVFIVRINLMTHSLYWNQRTCLMTRRVCWYQRICLTTHHVFWHQWTLMVYCVCGHQSASLMTTSIQWKTQMTQYSLTARQLQ